MQRPIFIHHMFLAALLGSSWSVSATEPVHEWVAEARYLEAGKWESCPGRGAAASGGGLKMVRETPNHVALAGDGAAGGGLQVAGPGEDPALPDKQITIEAWVRIHQALKWGGIVSALQDNGSYERGFILGYMENNFYFGVAGAQSNPQRISYLNANKPWLPGSWYHLVATYDGTVQRIYVDGAPAGESKAQRGNIFYAEQFRYVIGAYWDQDEKRSMNGDLQSVRVWDRALGAAEIRQRYDTNKEHFPGIEAEPEPSDTDLDWPTYRHDNKRSGRYPQDLPEQLHLQWVYQAAHPPQEAWPGTAQSDWWRKRGTPEKKRIVFDQVYEVVGAGDRLYYGSSSDDQLHCLDLASGSVRWTFHAEAPIRLAPTLADGRLLFGADDGRVYALDPESGRLLWRASAPEAGAKRLPGNGRVMSLFPVRSGVLVREGKAHFCSGLFPKSAGAWHCTVDVGTGKIIDQQAIEASPQGYLEHREGQLYLPTGRLPSGTFLAQLKAMRKSKARKAGAVSKEYPFASIETPVQRVGGGDGVVAVLSGADGTKIWEAAVKGKARSLAIVQGKLLVSTDQGMIYCFGARQVQAHAVAGATGTSAANAVDPAIGMALSQLPHRKGYALLLDAAADSGTAMERLTVLSGMQVIGVVNRDRDAALLRARLNKLGLYGRAVVHVAPANGTLPYVARMFNLVTSPRGLRGKDGSRGTGHRALLRPGTGAAFFNGPDGPSYRAPDIEGTGDWSHQYGDPGNTACSNDTRVGTDVRLQWFGRPGPQHMVDRHLRAPGPLVQNGYLFVPGRNYLFGIDAWNGAILWEKPVDDFRRIGVLRDSGSIVATNERLYAAAGAECLVLDTMTGDESLRITLPDGYAGGSHEWGYSAVSGSGVVGTAVKKGGVYRTLSYSAIYETGYGDNTPVTCSDCLFASNRLTGRSFWTYKPAGSILNPSIALSEKEVFFIESHNPDSLAVEGGRLGYAQLVASHGAALVCLDQRTGAQRWRTELPAEPNIQTLFVLYKDRKVVITNSKNAKAAPEAKPTLHYQVRVFDARDGALRWEHTRDFKARPNLDHGEQDRHPAIVGERLIVEPNIYDLDSGEDLGSFKRTGGGCGTISASSSALYFRARNPGTYDLETGTSGTLNSVSRPGCWINMIPASGLLVVPEGSSGCICGFPIQGSMAFAPN